MFCNNENDPTPVILGTNGGVFQTGNGIQMDSLEKLIFLWQFR